ncbi:MAG: 50S ribosomal protein L35 [Christensenellaceae bacterium]|jgi:large subunit ribosomal protein L35|nr:50S ribosomal protein L35 [Christensenellaceae bacterium]
MKIKAKTHSGAKKRFRARKNDIKRSMKNKNHILNKKSRERKRKLRHGSVVEKANEKTIRRLIQK